MLREFFKNLTSALSHEKPVSTWERHDVITFAKAKAIIQNNGEDASHLSMLQNAAQLYIEYIDTVVTHKGSFKRVFNAHAKESFVSDYAFDGRVISLSSIRVSDKMQQKIDHIKELAGIDSDVEFYRRALRLFTQMVIDEEYGWKHIRISGPDGPDGGEEIFEQESNQKSNVVMLFGNDNDEPSRIAASDIQVQPK